ncbi:MAG: histidine kinase N-terminal 7TM domain-containing protein [Spirochaetota bacterium]
MLMVISSGIEKFYTFIQFFSVLFLSIGLLVSVLTTMYLLVRPPWVRKQVYFALAAIAFTFWLFTELMLAVAPGASAVRSGVGLNCISIFILCRVFFLLVRANFDAADGSRLPMAIMATEAVAFVVIAFLSPSDRGFFSTLDFDAVVPGPFFFILTSLSIGWTVIGAWMLAWASIREKGERKMALRLALFSILLLVVAFILHHALSGNAYFPILPTVVPLAAILFSLSLIRYNLFGLLHYPVDALMGHIDLLILVAGDSGEILARNRDVYGSLDIRGLVTLEGLMAKVLSEVVDQNEGRQFQEAALGTETASGKLGLGSGSLIEYFNYHASPILYVRGRVGRILVFLDSTVEELSIRELHEKEAELRARYDELRIYSKTTAYHEAEIARESLVREANGEVRQVFTSVRRSLKDLGEVPDSNRRIDEALQAARYGLERIRNAVSVSRGRNHGGWM